MENEKLWYVVNTYSGHESKVKENLEMRTESMGMEDHIFRVIIPETKEVEIKDGVKKEKVKKMFPGYVLVEMIMSDEAWYVVRNTPGVTGFIGSSGKGAKPIPLTDEEVKRFIGDEERRVGTAYSTNGTCSVHLPLLFPQENRLWHLHQLLLLYQRRDNSFFPGLPV